MPALLAGYVVDGHVREPQGDSKARAETGTRRAAAEGDSCASAPSLLPCANRLAGVLAGVLALLVGVIGLSSPLNCRRRTRRPPLTEVTTVSL